MRVLVTGSLGFIGKNIVVRLLECPNTEVLQFVRGEQVYTLNELVSKADVIVHLAGVNRPEETAEFERCNADLTKVLCDMVASSGRKIPLLLASSTQAVLENPYGQSKLAAEHIIEQFAHETKNPTAIYRLPGVFGKWCKPNYNSVIATFCHNIANDLPIQINDPEICLSVVYVDDVVNAFLHSLTTLSDGLQWRAVEPIYNITLADLSAQLYAFKNCRTNMMIERVGVGLIRALYSTYMSYLPMSKFVYDLPMHHDERGEFVEMLKTPDCGQFSFFTAYPGITRGGHYHHSKSEKFLVIKGAAQFRFRHIFTGETYEIFTSNEKPQVVETIPGWTHDITNVGQTEMVVMLWANEVFDRQKPDTIMCKVEYETT